MIKIGLVLIVLFLAGAWLYTCSGSSNQTSQAPLTAPQAPGPSAQSPATPQNGGLFESAIPNITPPAKEQVRKSWMNMWIPDSRDPKYHDSQTTGKGIAERLPFGGITKTEPDRPWHPQQSVPDEEPSQTADEEPTKPAEPTPPKHRVVPRDQEIIIYVPRCPQEQQAYHGHDCEHCPEHRRPPDYYSTRVPMEAYRQRPRCSEHAFFDPDTGRCRCRSGGRENRFGFCIFDHGDSRPSWARNYE